MADDAAGAVRRTPHPAPVPELWWSPTECMVYADRGGAAPRYIQMRDTKHFPRPADAVELVSATRLAFALADLDEWKRIAEERNGTARVMADLRDQVAAAEAERDTARSDREELRSERDEIAGQLEDAQQHARNVAAQRDVEHRAFVEAAAQRDALLPRLAELAEQAGKLRTAEWLRTCAALPPTEWPPAPAYKGPVVPAADLDLAVWLHAELQHKLTLPCGECHPCENWADETWRRAGRKPPHVVTWEDKLAETRRLYARLDDAIKLIEEMAGHLRQDAALTIGVETRLAALRADEPAEPETGCMDGPAKQHTLHMVGIIKALKSAAGMDQLPLEPPSRDNFVRLARAIADYWPREIGRPPAEPTGETDRG